MAIALPSNAGLVRRLAAPSWVRSEALNVTPDLVGMPLAPHARRAWAMVVDLCVVAALSLLGPAWLAVGVAALVFQWLRRRRERSLAGNVWLGLVIAFLAWLAAERLIDTAQSRIASLRDRPAAAAGANDESDAADQDIDRAREILGDKETAALLRAATAASGAAVAASAAPVMIAASMHEAQLAARVKDLEGQLAEARKPRTTRWRDDVMRAIHHVGVGFGWAIAYFTLLPFWWKGQTVGKMLFGLRVVSLTGAPLTVISCFGRYGGYAAGMATGASGFLQVLWDSNRQAIQDKIAHTVVVDLRGARATVVADAAQTNAANAPGVEAVVGTDTGARIGVHAGAAPGEDAA